MNAADLAPATTALAIEAQGLGKAYLPYSTRMQRLRAALARRPAAGEAFWALRDLSLQVGRGESLGVIGRNGAGKSTLLQLLCGTLNPTTGSVAVNGRIAALLELGAGFNPEFSGRDNVLLNGPLLGMSREQLQEQMDAIIAFSGIGHFIEQPVKTYSSGMFVRLAFSLATSVQPDILVVDEALSVGDGEFARKSFDRILAMKERGVTILFCSHSLYQVEAFCDRVLWLDEGHVRGLGAPHAVVRDYTLYIAAQSGASLNQVKADAFAGAQALLGDAAPDGSAPDDAAAGDTAPGAAAAAAPAAEPVIVSTPGHARIVHVQTTMNGESGSRLKCEPGTGTLAVTIEFESDPALPSPAAGVTIEVGTVIVLASAVSRTDGVVLERDASGRGRATVVFDALPLRKGEYYVSAYLGSEDAIHIYSEANRIAAIEVRDTHPEPGVVNLPHRWELAQGPGPVRG